MDERPARKWGPATELVHAGTMRSGFGETSEAAIRAYSGGYQAAMAKSAGKQFTAATGVKVRWDTTDEFVSFNKIDQEIRAGQRPDVDASLQAQQRAYLDAARGLTLLTPARRLACNRKVRRKIAAFRIA